MTQRRLIVSNSIRERRTRMGLSQSALAKLVGGKTRIRDINRWESGKVLPRMDVAFLLAALLQCWLEDLFSINMKTRLALEEKGFSATRKGQAVIREDGRVYGEKT